MSRQHEESGLGLGDASVDANHREHWRMRTVSYARRRPNQPSTAAGRVHSCGRRFLALSGGRPAYVVERSPRPGGDRVNPPPRPQKSRRVGTEQVESGSPGGSAAGGVSYSTADPSRGDLGDRMRRCAGSDSSDHLCRTKLRLGGGVIPIAARPVLPRGCVAGRRRSRICAHLGPGHDAYPPTAPFRAPAATR
jgi:hypothetical protein